jgi:peptidoglycan pentaglycine glycine transferase (the first glycine)
MEGLMQIQYFEPNQAEQWDCCLQLEPSFNLMQSWAWGEFKENLGWKAYRIGVLDKGQLIAGAQLLVKMVTTGLASFAYIPRGPWGRWLDPGVSELLLGEIHRIAHRHRVIFLKIEPALSNRVENHQQLQQLHFKPSRLTNQPPATIILNLEPNLDEIMGQMRKRTREYIRASARKGVTIRQGGVDDLKAFSSMMQITARREAFNPRSQEYYTLEWQTFAERNQAVLLMAYYQEQLLAVHMGFCFGAHGAYFHGGSSKQLSELRPNTLLMWKAICWAKEHGCRSYDLWGIPMEVGEGLVEGETAPASSRSDELWGVYHFKRGFSKNVVGYVGAYDYAYHPMLYQLVNNPVINANRLEQILIWLDGLRVRAGESSA